MTAPRRVAWLAAALVAVIGPAAADEPAETLVRAIASADDDIEESASGEMYFDSSDLELVDDPDYNGNGQTVGLRFTAVDLPAGAAVTRAFIRFSNKTASDAPAVLTIAAFDSADAAAFATSPRDASGRPRLSTVIEWTPGPWSDDDTRYDTPDLSPLVAEIVARPDWRPGNAIGFVITGSGQRSAHSHDGRPDQAPELHVEFRPTGSAPALALADTGIDCDAGETGATVLCDFPELKLGDRVLANLYTAIRGAASPDAAQSTLDRLDTWVARREACGADYVCLRATLSDWIAELKAVRDGMLVGGGAAEVTTGLDCVGQRRGIDTVACNLDDVRAMDREVARLLQEIAAGASDEERAALQREQDDWVAATNADCAIECMRRAYQVRIVELRGRIAGAADPGELAVVGAWRGRHGCAGDVRDYVLDVRGVESRELKVRILGFADADAVALPDEDTWTDGWYDPGLRRFALGRFTGELSADGRSLQASTGRCREDATFTAVAIEEVEARLDAAWAADDSARAAAEAERRAAIVAAREELEAQLAARDGIDRTLIAALGGGAGIMDLADVGFPASAKAEEARDLFDAAGFLTALRASPDGRTCSGGVLNEWTTLATTVPDGKVPDRALPDCEARYSWGILTRLECTADIPFAWPVAESILPLISARLGAPDTSAPSADAMLATDHTWSCPAVRDGASCRLRLTEHAVYGRYELAYALDEAAALALARDRVARLCGGQQ